MYWSILVCAKRVAVVRFSFAVPFPFASSIPPPSFPYLTRPSSFCRPPPSALLQVPLFSGVFSSVAFVFCLSSFTCQVLAICLAKLLVTIDLEVNHSHCSHFGSRYTLSSCAGLFAGVQSILCVIPLNPVHVLQRSKPKSCKL